MQLLKVPIDHVCEWVFKLLLRSMSQLCGTCGSVSNSNINTPHKFGRGQEEIPKRPCYMPILKYNAHILLLVPLETVCNTQTISEFIFMAQIVSNKSFATT